MAFTFARALPILRGISELSGPDVLDVAGEELGQWVTERGEVWTHNGFRNAMDALERDGFITFAADWPEEYTVGENLGLIRLTLHGRRVVEGWPSTGGVDPDALAAALAAALDAAADDPNVPEEQRGMLRRIGEGALSTAVTTAVTATFGAVGISG